MDTCTLLFSTIDCNYPTGTPHLCDLSRYRNGIRGHLKDVLISLIHEYHRVESQFQQGSFDKCVISMREKQKNDVKAVVEDVLSHASVSKKNALVVQLIVSDFSVSWSN